MTQPQTNHARTLLTGVSASLSEALALAVLAPLAAAVWCSFGQESYAHWWGTSRGWQLLGQTLQLASLATLIALVLGFVLAIAAAKLPSRWAIAVLCLACLPMVMPSSTLATPWLALAGKSGPAAGIMRWIGGSAYSMPAAAAVLAARYFGIAAVVLLQYQRRILRMGPVETVFDLPAAVRLLHLRLVPAAGHLAAAGLVIMLLCMNDHIIPGMMLVSTYGPVIMVQYSALLDPAGAAALAVPVAAVCGVLVVCAMLMARRTCTDSGDSAPLGPEVARGATSFCDAAIVAAILCVTLGLPVTALVVRVGSVPIFMQTLWDARSQALHTLWLSIIAAVVAVAGGSLLARRWISRWRQGKPTLVPLVLINLTVPATLLGVGCIQLDELLGRWSLGSTSLPLLAAYVFRFLPVVVLLLFFVWRGASALPSLAARLHGVRGGSYLWNIGWPSHRPHLVGAALACALLMATELEMSIQLAAPGQATLGVRLYSLIHTAPESMVSALTLGMLLLAAPAAIAGTILLRNLKPREPA